jgi:hypothetical protein
VLFKQSRPQRRSTTSARRQTQAIAYAVQRAFAIVKRCVRKRGIHALHSLGLCCRRAAVSSIEDDAARPIEQLSATFGLIGRA